MTNKMLIECVPNFSEGRDPNIIHKISESIKAVRGVKLLNVDPGASTNRTVITFVGDPESVIEAAFCSIRKASELIDMTKHKGEHPRMGATDVCPLVPISDINIEETVKYAHKLAKRVADELFIPVYLYEEAAQTPERKNLSIIRAGQYEGLKEKLKDPSWHPDYGSNTFNSKSGATIIGVRDFLVAYNVNLNTTSVRKANSVAFDVREKGRIKREGHPVTGKIVRDKDGQAVRIPGKCKDVKAIGWFINEYGIAQITMNLTNLISTPLHVAFEACCTSATMRGMRVTGSELVGLIPKNVLVDAGKYFLKKQKRSLGIPEKDIIHLAVKTLGLNELTPFNPKEKVIEYLVDEQKTDPLITRSLISFSEKTASESPTPGGGSVSAYVAALGASLGTMVANLSANKRGWDERWEEFSSWAEKGQNIRERLLQLVDEDSMAFDQILEAFRLPKSTPHEKNHRSKRIEDATIQAIRIPMEIMKYASQSMILLKEMSRKGNPNSISDAGVGALCAFAAVQGAFLNVKTNCADLDNDKFATEVLAQAGKIMDQAKKVHNEILSIVNSMMESQSS